MIKIRQFSAEWCPPCQMWKKELTNRVDVDLEYISLDEKRDGGSWKRINENAKKYGLDNIKGVPFFQVERDGKYEIVNLKDLKEILKNGVE